MAQDDCKPLALLIDGDKTLSEIADGWMAQIKRYGVASVKPIYGVCKRSKIPSCLCASHADRHAGDRASPQS